LAVKESFILSFCVNQGAESRKAGFPLERFVRAACGAVKSESAAELGVRPAAGGANDQAHLPLWSVAE